MPRTKRKAAAAAVVVEEEAVEETESTPVAEEAEDAELGEPQTEDAEVEEEEKAEEGSDDESDDFRTGTEVVSLEDAQRRGMGSVDEAAAAKDKTGRVIYIGRLPTGFFEPQLRGFFGQFGDVRAVSLGRNPKTGHTRHFGFVEFARADVARIAAAAMDRYILDRHRLECRIAHAHIRALDAVPKRGRTKTLTSAAKKHARRVAAAAAKSDEAARLKRLIARDQKRRNALRAAGIDYDFPTVVPKQQ